MALPKYEGRITVTSSTTICTVGGTNVTIAAGSYYWTTSTSFLTTFKNALDTASGSTFTVTLDDNSDSSTGKITISMGSNFTLAGWDSTLRSYVGGTSSSYSGASTYTLENQARFLWLPDTVRADIMAPEPASGSTNLGIRETDSAVAMSPSGYFYGAASGTFRYKDRLRHKLLKANKVFIASESVTNESFEKFYSDVIGLCRPFRYHNDRSSDSVYWTQFVPDPDVFEPIPLRENWTGTSSLWSLDYLMRTYVQ